MGERMRGGSFRGAAVLALLFTVLGACRDRGGEGGGEAQAGGTAVVGMRSDFQALNPIVASDQYTVEVNNYALYTPLVTYNENLEVQPYLAESWEMLGDTGVVFKLRQDVKWHDGKPVTAEDVKFTFDAAKNPESGSLIGTAYVTAVESATVVDPYTIRFRFSHPHAQSLEDFYWAPAPKHLLESVALTDMRTAPFNRQPVGSGPFKFGEIKQGERLVLNKNPDFPEALGGPPTLDRVVFRIIPEPATMLTELMTGGVDVNVPVVPDQAKEIEASDQLELFAFPGRTVYFVAWNNEHELFRDADVRRAMTMAINRQDIIDALLFGHGRLASSPIPPQSPLHPEGVQPIPYSPDQAKQLLQSKGWTDSNGDGILDKGGKPFRFTLFTSDNPLNRSVAEVVQSHLKQVGVDAQIRISEFQTLLAQYKNREYEAVFANWVLDNYQVSSAPISLFHSSNMKKGSTNRTGFNNPQVDALMDRAAGQTDAAQARQLWGQFVQTIQQQAPVSFMFWLDELAAAGPRVQNVKMDSRSELATIAEWTVSGRR